MKYGLTIFPTAYAMHPAELGVALEERGFESFWVAEHSHIPASRESPWPGGPELPQMYYDTMDPFVALTAAATATTNLRVGTGIVIAPQRDAIHLAKACASLDVISNGRFELGVGAGWNFEEMRDHGGDPERRFGRMRETVEAIKELWTNDVAEYHGEQIDFAPTYQNPKPVQTPHPPIHVGGVFPGAMKRAVAYADGWFPILGRGDTDIAGQIAALHQACEEAGRDPQEVVVSTYAAPLKREGLDELQAAGVHRAVFFAPPVGREELLPMLDQWAELITD